MHQSMYLITLGYILQHHQRFIGESQHVSRFHNANGNTQSCNHKPWLSLYGHKPWSITFIWYGFTFQVWANLKGKCPLDLITSYSVH